jgi:ParB-like chromosome segregation protein Spo0J
MAKALEVHPLAAALPDMGSEEFVALCDSIRSIGQRDPITLFEGQILDGRHRYRACGEVGVEPEYELYDGEEPHLFVLGRNVARRHLTPSQTAMAAADVLAVFEGEARKRQGTRTDLVMTSSDGRLIKGTSSIGKARLLRPRAQKSAKRAAEDAAKAAGSTPRSVQRAKRVAQAAPAKAEEVRKGRKTLRRAEREVKEESVDPIISAGEREWKLRAAKIRKQLSTLGVLAAEIHGNLDEVVQAAQEDDANRHECDLREAARLLTLTADAVHPGKLRRVK